MIRQRLDHAAAAVRRLTAVKPSVAIILGSGLGASLDVDSDRREILYRKIPHWPGAGVPGHAGTLVMGRIGGRTVALLKGRAHYYEGWPVEDLAFPVRVLKRLGVRTLIVTAAAGSLRPALRPGQLVLLKDHINLLGTSPLRGAHEESLGPRFVAMDDAYDAGLRRAAKRLIPKAREAVYVAMPGPAYETAAEARMLRALGGDVVGMSIVPEVLAARQAGLRVLGIVLVSNFAAGLSRKPPSHAEVLATAARAGAGMGALLRNVVEASAK